MDLTQFQKATYLLSRINFLKELAKSIKNSGTIRIEPLNGSGELLLNTKTSSLAPNSQDHQYERVVDLLTSGITSEISKLQDEFEQM